MERKPKTLALPATMTSDFDDHEEGWLLVVDDERLSAALIRAMALEGALRQHDLTTTRLLTKDLVPATGRLWGEMALCALFDNLMAAGHWTESKPCCTPDTKILELPPLKVIEAHQPQDCTDLVRTESSFWMEVAPRPAGGVYVELYTYDRHTSRRIYTELPDDLLERALRTARFADVPSSVIGDVHATTKHYLKKWQELLEAPGLFGSVLSLMHRDEPDRYVFYDGPLHNVVVEVQPSTRMLRVSATNTTGHSSREASFNPTEEMEVQK